jgi:hypothetical protein
MLCSVRIDLRKSETYDSDGLSDWVVVPFRSSSWLLERSTVVQTVALFLVYAVFVNIVETVVSSRALLLLVLGSAYLAFTFRIRSGKVKRE